MLTRVSILSSIQATIVVALFLTPLMFSIFPIDSPNLQNHAFVLTGVGLSFAFLIAWRTRSAYTGIGSGVILVIANTILHSTGLTAVIVYLICAITILLTAFTKHVIQRLIVLSIVSLLLLVSGFGFVPVITSVGSSLAVLGLSSMFRLTGSQISVVVQRMSGQWSLVLGFLIGAALTIIVFALWYQFAFSISPESSFEIEQSVRSDINSSWFACFFLFLHQSVLTFATIGPPFRPTNSFARILVSLEAISSVFLLGIYLSLLINSLKTNEET